MVQYSLANLIIQEIQDLTREVKPFRKEILCEDINKLIRGRNKLNAMRTRNEILSNVVILELNMFGTSMNHRIRCHVSSTEIVTYSNVHMLG